MSDNWKPIPDYHGYYEVSERSDVRSVDREIVRSDGRVAKLRGKILRKGITKSGYEVVNLSLNGVTTSFNVHVLVAQAFLPNPMGYPLVRHLNDVGTDNEVGNLAWGTYSENRLDAVKSGAYVNQYYGASHCIRGHAFDEENTYLIPSGGRACRECRRDSYKEERK